MIAVIQMFDGLTDQAQRDEPSFPLFDLPPELWIRCCQLGVINPGPIIISELGDKASTFPPPITKTCRAIRAETLSSFYEANEFRFIDDGDPEVAGLTMWLHAIRSTHWPSVKICTVVSCHSDIVAHLRDDLGGVFDVQFDEEAPDNGETKILRFMAKLIDTPAGGEEECTGGIAREGTELEAQGEDGG